MENNNGFAVVEKSDINLNKLIGNAMRIIKSLSLLLPFLLISSAYAGWFGPSLSRDQKEWKIFHERAFSKELPIFHVTNHRSGHDRSEAWKRAFGYSGECNKSPTWDDVLAEIFPEEPPVKVLEDGYKMIKAYTRKRKLKNSEIIEKELVYWGWKYKVKNISKKPIYIEVEYRLKDKDEFIITSDIAKSGKIDPGEEYTIRDTGIFDYSDLERVYTSSWSIWHQEKSFP